MKQRSNIHPYLLQLITDSLKSGASDLHLKAGVVPIIRRLGNLQKLSSSLDEITPEQVESIVDTLLSKEQKLDYLKKKEIDLGLGITGLGRFRFNIFQQRGSSRLVIRNIPHIVPKISELNLPPIVEKIASSNRGLVLVTGISGSGKSSTLAAMVNHINNTKNKHILTIEDPIEYLIQDRKSIITQREIGVDATNYTLALRAALRQDPDVILIGEMRDRETIETAIIAAETGHLVLSTLHTLDAGETINRILSAFEPHQQNQIRLQLASVLNAVVSQRLIPKEDNKSFIPAVEVMLNSARIKSMIEDPLRTREIPLAIAEGRDSYGMQTFDQSLIGLVRNRFISRETAIASSNNPEDFKVHLSGISNLNSNRHWGEATSIESEQAWHKIKDIEVNPLPQETGTQRAPASRKAKRKKKA